MTHYVDIRRVFDSVSTIWVLVDAGGKVLLISRYLERFSYLMNPPLAIGSSAFDSIPDSWKRVAASMLDGLKYSTSPAMVEVSTHDPSGKEIHFEIKCTALRDDEGTLEFIFVEATDVTPQKIFERKITILAREYQNVIENANAVIIGIDARGYINDWNEMAHQVTGYSKNEALIRKLNDFLLPDCQQSFSHAMDSVLKGQVVSNHEIVIGTNDGRRLTLLINATPKTSSSGEVVGILLIGQDITELFAYRRSLEQMVKDRTEALRKALENERKLVEVKDRFVSMASHEFRSPISYIHRNIGLIADRIESMSLEDVRQRMANIMSQAEHLNSLLEDVLTIGKTGATNTRIKANLKQVDLIEFLGRIIDEVQTNTQFSHRIVTDFPVPSLPIETDENLLRNIFVNLLTNAIKFSPGRELVELALRKNEDHVECSLRDYGIGIGEADLLHIFEPFHRGENARQIKGTGLGLPIVKKALETIGGEVRVESKAGEGTVFFVRINFQVS